MGALILCDFALSIASVWVKNLLGIKGTEPYATAHARPYSAFGVAWKERHHSGDVLNRLEFDVANVVSFLTETIPSSVSTLAMFLGAFFYLMSMDWRLAINHCRYDSTICPHQQGVCTPDETTDT